MKWWQQTPASMVKPIPFIHPEAIKYLDRILQKEMTVCEFGGGGSTLWMAERVRSVITFENDPDWQGILRQQSPANVTLHSSMSDYKGEKYDLLFLDGEPLELRAEWIIKAPQISNGWIVLDNANRPEYAAERDGLVTNCNLINRVNGNEPGTKYLVTEFWRVK